MQEGQWLFWDRSLASLEEYSRKGVLIGPVTNTISHVTPLSPTICMYNKNMGELCMNFVQLVCTLVMCHGVGHP